MIADDRDISAARLMLTHTLARTTDQAPDVMRLPVTLYTDIERWQREVDTIFRKRPLIVGFSCELPRNGSYKALQIAGVSLLLTRSTDGVARAFLNVCRHRGAILAQPGQGEAPAFSCPYHGWSYDTKGRLIGVPRESQFGCVERGSLGLRQLACEERYGLIFAMLVPGLSLNVDEWLGSFARILEGCNFNRCHFFSEVSFPGPNWKLAMDGYLENYHFEALHAKTFVPFIQPAVLGVEKHGRHILQYSCARTISQLQGQPESEWKPKQHVISVPFVFPNTQIGFLNEGAGAAEGYHGGLVQIERIFPGARPTESVTIQTILSTEPITGERQIAYATDWATLGRVAVETEDYRAGTLIQDGLSSNANEEFILGRNELCLQHFHTRLAEELSREVG
jgi:nitrite reductase/ring-hydroxylating ferredoxin subunit